MCSEESDMSITDASLLPVQQQESNISPQSSALFLPFNRNELSFHFNDENSLTPYDRLQEHLRPITEIATSDITVSSKYQSTKYFNSRL
jgi:hypothetical protein